MKNDKNSKHLKYDQQYQLLVKFIKEFEDYSLPLEKYEQEDCYKRYGYKKYLIQIVPFDLSQQKIANQQTKIIEIFIEDLEAYFRRDQQAEMVNSFRFNTFRYLKMFEKIVSEIMPQRTKQLNPEEEIQAKFTSFLKQQRLENFKSNTTALRAENQNIPFRIHQNFDVAIIYGPNSKVPLKTIGELKADNIGELITTKAIVVRASEVRPELVVATYACDICNCQNYMEIYDANFKPLVECKSKKCEQARMGGKLTFLATHSKFRSFQELKMQQTPEQLQRGSIPKSIHLQLRGNFINIVQPGDIVKVQGIILPQQLTKNMMKQELFFDSYIYVTKIITEKKKYVDMKIDEKVKENVLKAHREMGSDELFNSLAQSIAPEIYGLEHVKKALLLQMAGGVTTETEDHLRIRGEINIALFGDPGIAKSQLLKHISYVSPRAVYTTGKGSSGVGLTAAIVTDPRTKQLSLEAGALVLADMGVCCIDEFDKMDEYDRTAIHEVMEQQTVSITKAGIITTLNARTAVLAAANPLYGRYNRQETTQKNLNLPAALLSRFDLIFVMLDNADKEKDFALATHIGQVHQRKKKFVSGIFDEEFLKTYIAMAKEYEPIIPEEVNEEMIKKYIEKRQIQMDASREGESYTTMRSLLALIRLSQAKAKLRFSRQVQSRDVAQSIQLIQKSQQSVQIQQTNKYKVDDVTNIFELIKMMCYYDKIKRQVDLQKARQRCILRGFSSNNFDLTVQQYENLGVINVTENKIIKLIE